MATTSETSAVAAMPPTTLRREPCRVEGCGYVAVSRSDIRNTQALGAHTVARHYIHVGQLMDEAGVRRITIALPVVKEQMQV